MRRLRSFAGPRLNPEVRRKAGARLPLLNNLVSAHQHRLRHSEAERLEGL